VRGQVLDLHALHQHKAVIAHDPLDVRSARAVVPPQEGIARPQPERRRHEREHTQRPASGCQQIAQPTAGGPGRTQRMVLVEQCGAQPPLRRRAGQVHADLAEFRQ